MFTLLFKQSAVAAFLTPVFGVLLVFSSPVFAIDADGSLVAAGGVSEPVAISSLITTAGTALDVFDFSLSDGGSGDTLPLAVSEIVLNTSGTATAVQWDKVTWRLNGAGSSNIVGVYSAATNKLTFTGLSISVADGGNETYTLSAFFNDNTGLSDAATFSFSVDGDSDAVVSAAGTQMGATTALSNGGGSAIDVVATQLIYTTAPAGSVSGIALTTQPVVAAQDAGGNTDIDFTGLLTLSESSAGSLTNSTATAVSGVATFLGLAYAATADGESFALTAAEPGSLSDAVSAVLSGDVVATSLEYTAQPAPLAFEKDVAVALTTAPVVQAVDAGGLRDTDFTGTITLSETGATGTISAAMAGDTDAAADTVSLAAIAGVATFNGLSITYSSAGVLNEVFTLRANAAGVSAADSVALAGIVDGNAPRIASIVRFSPATASTNADTLVWRVSLGEVVVGVDANSFVVAGTTAVISSVSEVSVGTVFDVTVSGGDLASANTPVFFGVLSVQNITDVAGNALVDVSATGANESSYLVDNDAPSLLISAPSVSSVSTGPVVYTVTYSGADNIALDANVSLLATGTATGTLAVAGTGLLSRAVTISDISGDGTLGISIAANTASDTAGNQAAALNSTTLVSVDNSAPVLSIGSPSLALTGTSDVSYSISYSAADTISLAVPDITLHKTGTANAVVAVSGSGLSSRTVSISSIAGDGSLGISIAADTASDTTGNRAAASVVSTLFTVDNTAPTVALSTPSSAATQAGPITYTVTYTNADVVSLSDIDISLSKTGTADGVVAVSGSGSLSRTVTVSGIAGEGSLGISLAANTASDTVGNMALASAASTTFVVDNSAPRISSILHQAPVASPTNADVLIWRVAFDGGMSNVDASDFSVSGTTAVVTGVTSVVGSSSYDVTASGGDLSVFEGNVQLSISNSQNIVDLVSQALVNTVPVGSDESIYRVDNTSPILAVTMANVALLDSETTQVVFTFDEAVSGFSSSDVSTVDNGVISAFAVSASDDKVYTATFIPDSGVIDLSNVIALLGSSYTDLAGNVGSDATGPNYSIVDSSTNAVNEIKAAADTDNASAVTIDDLNAVTGVSGAILANEAAYRLAIEVLMETDLDTALEIQALIDSVNALEQVKAAADANDASQILFSDLNTISNVAGAVSQYEGQYQVAIAQASAVNVDSAAEVQALVDSVNALEKVKAAAGAGDASAVVIADLNVIAGVSELIVLNESLYQAAIAGLTSTQLDTENEVYVLVKQVNAIAVITSYADDNVNTAPATADYLNAGLIGITVTNLSSANLSVDGAVGNDVDGLAKIRAVVGIGILDSDADGIADIVDGDDDNDGILDSFENPNVNQLTGIDNNANGIDDGQDASILTGDDANLDGIVDALALADFDGDGIANLQDRDSDNDGLPDSVEYAGLAVDSDGDGIVDGFRDDNVDGVHDYSSLQAPVDTDGDGQANPLDLDSDGDSSTDLTETGGETLDLDGDGVIDNQSDADRDGILDVVDPVNSLSGVGQKLTPSDSDGDGIVDYLDADIAVEASVEASVSVVVAAERKTAAMSFWLMLCACMALVVRVVRIK